MLRRRSPIVFITAVVCAATFYFSCTQPDDIITSVERTDLYLNPQLLPTNPVGMVYQLWLTDEQDTLSLGRFGYNQLWLTFRNENGEERPDSNHFVLDGDIFDYSHIFVSIETISGDDTLAPGPIMLIDDVTDPSSDLIELRFPLNDSLWLATAIFNMETPSDSDRTINGGYGIWFSAFYWSRDSVQDTLSLDSFTLVTKEDSSITIDTVTSYLDSILNDTAYDTARVFGLDTFVNTVVRFDSVLKYDSTFPYTVMDMREGKTEFYYTVGVVSNFFYDNFIQFDFGLLDYSSWGWHYKGWAVSPEVDPSAVGKITPPAYEPNTNPFDSLIPGIEGGLLSTGTFCDISAPDDSNLYSIGPRVPPYPGEDFLVNLPDPSFTGFVPDVSDNSGAVFITLEPDNFVTDTTNFPLFVLVGKIPATRDSIFGTAIADTQLFEMDNLTNTNDSPFRGFPMIEVEIRRF